MAFPGLRNGILKISTNSDYTTNAKIITDHNRAELTIGNQRIETRNRMVNGTLRVNFIANKLTISTSWDIVPSLSSQCVDYRAATPVIGANELKDLYESSNGNPVYVTITAKTSTGETLQKPMIFSSFEYRVVKRSNNFDLVNMSVELEEV